MRLKKTMALVLSAVLAGSVFTACGKANPDSTEQTVATSVTEAEQETEIATETTVTEETTAHVSPTETVSTTLGTELSEINATLDRDGTNSYSASLSHFIEEGDVVQSFTFIVYSGDGSTSLGDYKGGYGVSVKDGSSVATDEGWYEAADFEENQNSAYAEFTWNVPSDVAADIDVNGEVMFGHWWSNVQQVRLSSIVCTYTRTKEVPVDGTSSAQLGTTLRYNDEQQKTAQIDLADLIGNGDTLQTVTFDISSTGSLGKFTGAFGVSVSDDAKCATDDGWYQTENVCVFTDGSSLSLTWIIPDDIKEDIAQEGVVMLGYWWSDQDSITLDNISCRYSNNGTETKTETISDATAETVEDNTKDTPDADSVDAMSSAEIVADISVGWNLGNSLDSYDTNSSDTETGWGNPKTTREMIQTVKQAGFNAIRIPVTWGEHMSADGTIDADWMARVHEVVDYAYDEGLYVILNTHHDDAVWIVPTYDKLESNKSILGNIWKQIAEEFAEYDHRLLFEGLNEIRVIGSSTEWSGGTEEERDCINQMEQVFVDVVRATGGKNADRTLIITSHAQSITEPAVKAVKIPDDDHIVVSIHSYAPYNFCGPENADADWGTDADKAELDANFKFLADTFISQGVPVILDETGAVNKNNTSARAAWYEYYISSAKNYGIKCFVWDNGEKTGDSAFGLLDRDNLTWYFPEIINAIMNGAK